MRFNRLDWRLEVAKRIVEMTLKNRIEKMEKQQGFREKKIYVVSQLDDQVHVSSQVGNFKKVMSPSEYESWKETLGECDLVILKCYAEGAR